MKFASEGWHEADLQQEHLCHRQHWIAPRGRTESVCREIVAYVHASFHSELSAIQFHSMGRESQGRMGCLKSSPCPPLSSMNLPFVRDCLTIPWFSQKKLTA